MSPTGFRNDDDLFKESTMTFGAHLEELRSALLRSLIGLAIAFVIGLAIGNHVVHFFEQPVRDALIRFYTADKKAVDGYLPVQYHMDPADLASLLKGEAPKPVTKTNAESDAKPKTEAEAKAAAEAGPARVMIPITLYERVEDSRVVNLTTLSAQEAFMIWMKAALITSAVLASPWVFYQIWMFVAAGLYPHEKRYVHIFLPISVMLFMAGASIAFFFVFGFVLDFLFGFNKWLNLNPEVRIAEWLSFVLMLPIGFGISFQLPLVMLFLERIHVFTIEKYLSNWRISIMAIFVIAMILTPADPYSMLLMAVPLCVLYYLGIALCKWMPRGESPFAFLDAEAEKDQEKVKV